MAGRVNELDLDQHFWRAISTDRSFHDWFIARTKFFGRDLELVTDEKWHQRWYRDPETKKDSETDILLIFRDRTDHLRYAVHIENKPDHRNWTEGQAEKYRKRAFNRMSPWRYVDFQTALIAPVSFIARWPVEAGHFDVIVSHEDISAFVPAFATTSQIEAGH
jgi:hypothetical protein